MEGDVFGQEIDLGFGRFDGHYRWRREKYFGKSDGKEQDRWEKKDDPGLEKKKRPR